MLISQMLYARPAATMSLVNDAIAEKVHVVREVLAGAWRASVIAGAMPKRCNTCR